jgi:hypothetical protein
MLPLIKVVHTIVWAFFASAILALPVFAWRRQFGWVIALAIVVSVEVTVLALNRLRCPLTDVAARYTDDRRPNFDIYLPAWLAARNKEIFGPLFAAGVLLALARALGV